jgi:hypothetical protein
MVAAADPLVGTEVRRFKLVRLIGRGGMGRVYEGVRPDIGSRVAIKVIAEEYAHDAEPDRVRRGQRVEHSDRFFAEARMHWRSVSPQFLGEDDLYFWHYDSDGWRVGHDGNGAIIAKFPDDC